MSNLWLWFKIINDRYCLGPMFPSKLIFPAQIHIHSCVGNVTRQMSADNVSSNEDVFWVSQLVHIWDIIHTGRTFPTKVVSAMSWRCGSGFSMINFSRGRWENEREGGVSSPELHLCWIYGTEKNCSPRLNKEKYLLNICSGFAVPFFSVLPSLENCPPPSAPLWERMRVDKTKDLHWRKTQY